VILYDHSYCYVGYYDSVNTVGSRYKKIHLTIKPRSPYDRFIQLINKSCYRDHGHGGQHECDHEKITNIMINHNFCIVFDPKPIMTILLWLFLTRNPIMIMTCDSNSNHAHANIHGGVWEARLCDLISTVNQSKKMAAGLKFQSCSCSVCNCQITKV